MRALLEPRCGGTEGTEYLHICFKSSGGYVLIVYAFMYALLNGYLLYSKANVIIYAQTMTSVGWDPKLADIEPVTSSCILPGT